MTKLKSYVDSGILGGNADRIWVCSLPARLLCWLMSCVSCSCMTVKLAPAADWPLFYHVQANPDCGLKTRDWKEVIPSMDNMVKAAASMRNGAKA